MPLEPGTTIGDYHVLALLGTGGMGQVYKVRNLLSNRIEALKVLVSDVRAQGDLAERFLREIQVHASLAHSNIAAMHTAQRLENQLVMLMKFVEGRTLGDLLQGSGLPVTECLRYTTEILSALSYAHQQGVIHRDIKPSNVLVTSGGTVKLMDFGMAASVVDKRLTRTASFKVRWIRSRKPNQCRQPVRYRRIAIPGEGYMPLWPSRVCWPLEP